MSDMLHEIQVRASPREVITAITSEVGLRAWWTGDVKAVPEVGSVAEFGFGDRSTVFRMRIDEISASSVRWLCQGDPEQWTGTRLEWDVQPKGDATIVRFAHLGWATTEGMFARCNTTWGALMHRLKAYLEGANPGPLFTGRK